MGSDRRRHPRHPRLLRVVFDFDRRAEVGVTTDVSEGGAFINTVCFPAVGSRLDLTHSTGDGPDLVLHSVVIRVVDTLTRISVVPGVAVRWLGASTAGTAEHLRAMLRQVLDVTADVRISREGRALWFADVPDRSSPEADALRAASLRSDLARLEDVRPPLGPKAEGTGHERRVAERTPLGIELLFYVNQIPLHGRVRDVSLRGLWVHASERMPHIGDLVTCRYPLPGDAGPARLVGIVVRVEAGRNPGFGVEILRIDHLGPGEIEGDLVIPAVRDVTE